MRNYYKVLGISESASQEEVREAYRKLAMQWHPDRNPSDPMLQEMMKLYNAAYEVLSDPIKRHAHNVSLGLQSASDNGQDKINENGNQNTDTSFGDFDNMSNDTAFDRTEAFEHDKHVVSVFMQIVNAMLSVFLLLYGSLDLIKDDIFFPHFYWYRISDGTHFHGKPALVLYAAILCVVLNRLSAIVRYYDRSKPKINYRLFGKVTIISAVVLVFSAIALKFILELNAILNDI